MDALINRLKREAGAIPARSRRCVGEAFLGKMSLESSGKTRKADDPKSENLPVLIHRLLYGG